MYLSGAGPSEEAVHSPVGWTGEWETNYSLNERAILMTAIMNEWRAEVFPPFPCDFDVVVVVVVLMLFFLLVIKKQTMLTTCPLYNGKSNYGSLLIVSGCGLVMTILYQLLCDGAISAHCRACTSTGDHLIICFMYSVRDSFLSLLVAVETYITCLPRRIIRGWSAWVCGPGTGWERSCCMRRGVSTALCQHYYHTCNADDLAEPISSLRMRVHV